MSKRIAAVFGITCLFWVAVWAWLVSGEIEQQQIDADLPTTSLNISDPKFNFAANDIFSFHQSDARPVIPADNLVLFQSLARHLGENPDRELELNGQYAFSETNKTPHPNLGIARAKAIEKLLVAEGAPASQIFTSATAVQNLYLMRGRLMGGVNFIFSEEKEMGLHEGGQLEDSTNMAGEAGFPQVVKTVEDDLPMFFYAKREYQLGFANRPFLDSLRRALRTKPQHTVIISGFSQSGEEKAVEGNLAEMRAKAVRRYLIDNGLRRRQIVVVSHPGSSKNEDARRVELKVESD